jgi:hypothetical protein
MNINKAFNEFYATIGIRTPAPNGEGKHWHEEYQRIAFEHGCKAGIKHCEDIVDRVGEAIKSAKE